MALESLLVALVEPIWNLAKLLWQCAANHEDYISDAKTDVESLKVRRERLKQLKEEVEARVAVEEKQLRQPTYKVGSWLARAGNEQEHADKIISESEEQFQRRCLGCLLPTRNFCLSNEVGKKVRSKLKDVTELIEEGNFDVVTERKPHDPVDERPMERTVGLDTNVSEVWRWVQEHGVGIIGIYGMGGVGKTTLLKKINNKFLSTSRKFDVVIWVVVSKEGNLGKIQEAICNKLSIPNELWRGKDEDERAVVIHKVLRNKMFVLLLDDLWNQLELVKVGLPPLDETSGSKVVFTTRSEEVCISMKSNHSIKLECLAPEQAFELFQMHVGQRTLNAHRDIAELAKVVVRECQGLPLALITTGRALASRRKPEEWQHAISMLQSYPSEFPGMGNHVFPILKYSYDSLSNDKLRSCFLYCSFFPEDHNIHKHDLIELWIKEGLLDRFDNVFDARNEGEFVLETLKLTCLLGRGVPESYIGDPDDYVRMHDVIRDMALWLARDCGKEENKLVVLEHARLTGPQGFAKWKDAERLSIWGSSFKNLAEAPPLPYLSTLLVRCTKLTAFPSGFFQQMDALSILDLSGNRELKELPVDIGCLIYLQHLNFSRTRIGLLPPEVKNLKKLKSLLMDETHYLTDIPEDVISSLLSLQVFSKVQRIPSEFFTQVGLLEELQCLKCLVDVGVTLNTMNTIQKFFCCHELQRSIRHLSIIGCWHLSSLDVPSSSLWRMEHLEILDISHCPVFEQLTIQFQEEGMVQEISPYNLPPSNSMRNWQAYFLKLGHVNIASCPKVKDLTWLIYAPSLQTISLELCRSMVEIIANNVGSVENMEIFPNLKRLSLIHLRNLKRICQQVLPLPSLRKLCVQNCPRLERLPFDCNSAKYTLEMIEANEDWWESLQWDNNDVKSAFSPKFREVKERWNRPT